MEQTLQVILIAAGALVVVIMLFAAAACAVRRKNRGEIPITRPLAATGPSSTFDLKQVSMAELEKATHNFSPDLIIGHGSFGMVYKARLPHAGLSTVAVKKLSPDAFQGFCEFRAEMAALSKLRHPNIVTILGFCDTGSDRVLVYEYVENGSLDQWLLLARKQDLIKIAETPRSRLPLSWETSIKIAETPRSSRLPLSWETRIKIVRGVASGLAYMHNLQTPIIHRNIKASKVLLDSDFEPHIADFGFSRIIDGSLSHVSTRVAGTMGYMPPEYIQGATMATAMGDVYSFGILMLEISTGIRPDLPFKEERNGKEVRLVEWAREKLAQNLHMEILDANISRAGLEQSGVVEFLRIAFLCASDSSMDRPPMREVVELLNQIPT
ncbi:leucine-rich repeat receptor protein kinase EMS1-like [Rhododendron vialii]|uniref:leucine-rich repeat receptor protein kinase EMS1-like n=1 Tax=Rhododendron vialii TaxID=182163 RepID=UPI00265EE4EB|nr:leucine-rich repeat receptor protein kinase EMS1-like [Rhododendron vialii]